MCSHNRASVIAITSGGDKLGNEARMYHDSMVGTKDLDYSSIIYSYTAPTSPPTFDRVDRASSDGKTITASFTVSVIKSTTQRPCNYIKLLLPSPQLPERNISCMPDHLIVKYSNNSGFAANTTIALSNYKPSVRSYTANVSLAQAQCWEEYNISIAYGNDEGNSGFGNSTLTIRGPMEGLLTS